MSDDTGGLSNDTAPRASKRRKSRKLAAREIRSPAEGPPDTVAQDSVSPDILANAYILGADNIDVIDRRIASYETRRMAVMRAIEDYNEKFARKLDAASKDVVDAEFTDLPAENA